MKSIFLFSSKLRVYLTELPIILLLTLAIHFHNDTEALLKFYPIEIISALGIMFIAVYFFRGILITPEEIKAVGLFSSRDKLLIKKDMTLKIEMKPKRILGISIWGNDGTPAFDWQSREETLENGDLRLFSEKAVGGASVVKRLLISLSLPAELTAEALEREGFTYENENVSIATERRNEIYEISIKFKETYV